MLLESPLWRQTPPAAFPVCLGFLSLALAWRASADILPWVSEDLSNLTLAAATGYFLWFLAFYLASGVAADLIHIASNPFSNVPTIGASGAIAGVMGGYLLLFPKAKIDILIIIVVFFIH